MVVLNITLMEMVVLNITVMEMMGMGMLNKTMMGMMLSITDRDDEGDGDDVKYDEGRIMMMKGMMMVMGIMIYQIGRAHV